MRGIVVGAGLAGLTCAKVLAERGIEVVVYEAFYGGTFLDRSLLTSSRVLRFTFKMLPTGKTGVPARGIGEIPKQLAARLSICAVRTNSPVRSLLREGDRVVGVEAA